LLPARYDIGTLQTGTFKNLTLGVFIKSGIGRVHKFGIWARSARRSESIPNWGHSDLGVQSRRKNQPACLILSCTTSHNKLTWAEKWQGAAMPLSVGGAWSPSNTLSPEPRPSSIPSGILIYIQPFGHNSPTLQTEHRYHSTGKLLLVTVTQKLAKHRKFSASSSTNM